MTISEALLPEFDMEMSNTRKTLERVPNKPDFTPHPKSMPLGRLAPHVAELAGFGLSVLETPQVDFSAGSYKPLRPKPASSATCGASLPSGIDLGCGVKSGLFGTRSRVLRVLLISISNSGKSASLMVINSSVECVRPKHHRRIKYESQEKIGEH